MELKRPVNTKKKLYSLKNASIKRYVYTKTYYRFDDNGEIIQSDNGNDNDLTIINIFKKENNDTEPIDKSKKAFIFADGYIGAERSYNKDGTKAHSVTRKSVFGLEFFIKYIEENERVTDNFHAIFLSDKVSSEKQAELFAQAIKDISQGNVEKTYMWCHSKAALNALRALQKMRENGKDEDTLRKIRLTLSGMPTKGLDSVNRAKVVNELDKNRLVNLIPFSGFFKTMTLAFYDKYLYKPTPAQVDLKIPTTIEEKSVQIKHEKLKQLFDKIWGNDAFKKQIAKEKKVDYDSKYINRVTSRENMESIQDIQFKTLLSDIDLQTAIDSLVKNAQLMPFILYAKKMILSNGFKGEKGDGIVKLKDQGTESYFKPKNPEIKTSHDIAASKKTVEEVAKEMLK